MGISESGGGRIVQENEPGIPAQLMMCGRKPGSRGRLAPVTSLGNRAYFGGVFVSAGGGVELMEPLGGGVELSDGGMVVVVPGAADVSAGGAVVEVSAGGELAEPPGEVDSCLEQADNSASEPTHNNRTLRFIRSPHCNGTVTMGPSFPDPLLPWCRKWRSATAHYRRVPATTSP